MVARSVLHETRSEGCTGEERPVEYAWLNALRGRLRSRQESAKQKPSERTPLQLTKRVELTHHVGASVFRNLLESDLQERLEHVVVMISPIYTIGMLQSTLRAFVPRVGVDSSEVLQGGASTGFSDGGNR